MRGYFESTAAVPEQESAKGAKGAKEEGRCMPSKEHSRGLPVLRTRAPCRQRVSESRWGRE